MRIIIIIPIEFHQHKVTRHLNKTDTHVLSLKQVSNM